MVDIKMVWENINSKVDELKKIEESNRKVEKDIDDKNQLDLFGLYRCMEDYRKYFGVYEKLKSEGLIDEELNDEIIRHLSWFREIKCIEGTDFYTVISANNCINLQCSLLKLSKRGKKENGENSNFYDTMVKLEMNNDAYNHFEIELTLMGKSGNIPKRYNNGNGCNDVSIQEIATQFLYAWNIGKDEEIPPKNFRKNYAYNKDYFDKLTESYKILNEIPVRVTDFHDELIDIMDKWLKKNGYV